MDDEEQTILSSLLAKLQDQGEYEDDVLRNARHEMAPRLTGIGLPIPIEEDFGNFDLPLIHNLLTKIRRQIQQLLQNSSSSSTNQTEKNLHMLYMKEQILLHVALEKSSGEFALRLDEERKMEQARSLKLRTQQQQQQQQQLQQQQQQQKIPAKSHDMDDDEKMQKKRVQFQADAEEPLPAAAKIAMSRKRVPMMKRKRIVVDDDDAVSEEENQRGKPKMDTQQLKALREQRTQRIRNSRRTCRRRQQDQPGSSSESTCSDEDENEMEFELDEDAVVTATPSLQRKDATGDDSHHTEAMHVTCPICQEQITVDSSSMESDPDSILAQHMAACQTKPPRRTTRTRGNRSATGSNTEDAATTSTSTRTNLRKGSNDANVSKKNTRQKRNRAIPGRQQFLKPNIAIDDYDEIDYEDRVDNWIESGLARMKEMKERDLTETLPGEVEYPGGLYIPAWINDRLFGYQREGLRWMWELHQQEAGGILGDMMGLGKTVQIAAFLGAMACSRQLKSVLIVSPATLLQHWLSELATWAPGLRRILIHSSGGESNNDGFVSRNVSSKLLKDLAFWLKNARSNRVNEAIDDEDLETYPAHSFCGTGYIIVTTYENLRRNADIYQNHDWSYLVLDEAQKIRNPDADITLACKRIRTPHRIAMTGTPIQNDLRELWSIMDFCFPGRLGTLPAFEQEFAIPIKRGGYSNATPTQVQLAYRCAIMLRDLIEPFLLRRLKKDVKEVSRMPGKTEHVLFCRLSQRQRQMYEAYLQSDDVARVLKGNAQIFAAVTMLRKITNHPDLVCDPDEKCFESFVRNAGGQHITSSDGSDDSGDEYVDHDETLTERSGKLEILSKILPLWHKQGHRVIIFSQWCKMLNIIERFLTMKGWKFGRLDGNTNIASRQRLVDAFNTDDSYFAMLCTTRTGGVGLNLTGANRIILYDPDWNPSSDAQARERAWRYGQQKEVTIYRLITAGTIEEKIYHRQIFKTALSNKVLQDPKQRRLFSQRDLRDLFTLNTDSGSIRSGGDGIMETSKVTKGVGVVEDEDLEEDDDNTETLKKVMKSKGLAGIFDHHAVENDDRRKSATAREIEEHAKRVAREAAEALQHSISSKADLFEPTWTGSDETKPALFGSSSALGAKNSFSSGALSSSSLLATIRQRNIAVETGGRIDTSNDDTMKYAHLMGRLKQFVRLRRPDTEQLLNEFDGSVADSDIAIFRRMLQSIATLNNGRWYLSENA